MIIPKLSQSAAVYVEAEAVAESVYDEGSHDAAGVNIGSRLAGVSGQF